ncbi:MAG: DNA alkylation repair protein [Candidatus Nomurabacteria bacterium]|jgi:3-methyladenine DNA glycosylase AlkD|nr:DNA alkylation repair protein [Candidatus Nomurabacteria bacterium]
MNPSWREKLQKLAEGNHQFAKFASRTINSKQKIIGVRMPDLHDLAKNLSRQMAFADVSDFAKSINHNVHEEVLLLGLIINYAKLSDTERIKPTEQYLKLVDNWAQIDSVATMRRKINQPMWWDFSTKCLKSPAGFTVRFGIVFLMTHFIADPSIDKTFQALGKVTHDDYYVKMALAWFYATAAVKYFEKTLRELERPTLPSWTHNKALQKILESRRFSKTQKQQIRTLKKCQPLKIY